MSEVSTRLAFTVQNVQKSHWLTLLEGLLRGEMGAYLEERVEPFGSPAEALLEGLLDDCDNSYLELGNLKQADGNGATRFSMILLGGGMLRYCFPRILKLLEACGAEDIEYGGLDDEG